MGHQSVKTEIEEVVTDKKMSVEEQIARLEKMREEVRAQMRAATESGMVDDDGLGESLRYLDEALENLDSAPESIEDTGAATL